MLKMLIFVDAIVALDPCEVAGLEQKMHILLCVHGALSAALSQLRFSSPSRLPSAQVARIQREIASLLSAKDDEATQAISGTMSQIWGCLMESMDASIRIQKIQTPHGSSDVHNVTRAATDHFGYLWDNYSSVTPIVFQAACRGYAAEVGDTKHPLASLTIQMMPCLEEKLDRWSKSFPDQGLRFLFMMNNYCYILQQLHDHNTHARNLLHLYFAQLSRKIKSHELRYPEVSWAPVLSCLRYRGSSPLPKFERTFCKTYNAQKLWKVPDPELRERLRKAITKKIVSGYTNYIKDNGVTTLKFSPQELQEMLRELFEG
ncbi:hypothetical protein BS78_10G261600 [Paspalum vaginatum]|nr:hypothetical protein BS78_10G261600 [Paspalum vaginatum]